MSEVHKCLNSWLSVPVLDFVWLIDWMPWQRLKEGSVCSSSHFLRYFFCSLCWKRTNLWIVMSVCPTDPNVLPHVSYWELLNRFRWYFVWMFRHWRPPQIRTDLSFLYLIKTMLLTHEILRWRHQCRHYWNAITVVMKASRGTMFGGFRNLRT
jgi:hypothetical protein